VRSVIRGFLPLVLLLVLAETAVAGWRIIRLPFNGAWYEGLAVYRVAAVLERAGFGRGYYAVYAADAWPGADYSFGLRYAGDLNVQVQVALFDRWPFDPRARRYDLPLGPVLRRQDGWIDYRWRFSVAPDSPGDQLFILVEARTLGRHWPGGGFRHRVSLVAPALDPKNLPGQGVTYLQGPRDLVLAQPGEPLYGFEWMDPRPVGDDPPLGRDGCGQPPGDLIRNGDFCSGVQHWETTGPDSGAGIAVGAHGLRLFGRKEGVRSGLNQRLYVDVSGAETLLLRADLRIAREEKTAAGCRPVAPVVVSVCYEDEKRQAHCGPTSLWRAWTIFEQENDGCDARKTVARNRWFRYVEDLMQLRPRPRIIRSITVEGAGTGERDATVREIHLIDRGAIRWRDRP